jgi:predicted dienelactone hydrolase
MLRFASVALLAVFTAHALADENLGRAQRGPHKVLTLPNVKLVDADLGYTLGMVVHLPEGDRPAPVIIFSHGLGGSGAAYAQLLEHWASHGYVCIAPTHGDSQLLRPAGERLDMSGWAQRVHDMRLIIASLNPLQELYPPLRDRIDISRVGIAGHSFGAYTAQLVGGATIDIRGGEKARSFADHRPSAVLLLSPQGTDQQGLTRDSWKQFTKPLMVMTGSEDRGIRGQSAQWRLEPFTLAPEGEKYAILIEGANHFSFSGRFARGQNQPEIFDYIKAASLAFWDAYLQRDQAAGDVLRDHAFAPDTPVSVEFQHK